MSSLVFCYIQCISVRDALSTGGRPTGESAGPAAGVSTNPARLPPKWAAAAHKPTKTTKNIKPQRMRPDEPYKSGRKSEAAA
ncbi:hypothetical protein ACVIYL_008802 [Bradyrhizobium sp. USDA 3315]